MKWAVLVTSYKIKVVEADTIEQAAAKYLEEAGKREKRPVKSERGRKIPRTKTPRIQSVSIVDMDKERIREFEFRPPPAPPVEQWVIEEILDDEDEEEDPGF